MPPTLNQKYFQKQMGRRVTKTVYRRALIKVSLDWISHVHRYRMIVEKKYVSLDKQMDKVIC